MINSFEDNSFNDYFSLFGEQKNFDLNLPVVVNYKNGEFEVVNKTIMRKKDFRTSSPEIKYESQDPDIKDREGTQPSRYHAGLKKSTKAKNRQKNKPTKRQRKKGP